MHENILMENKISFSWCSLVLLWLKFLNFKIPLNGRLSHLSCCPCCMRCTNNDTWIQCINANSNRNKVHWLNTITPFILTLHIHQSLRSMNHLDARCISSCCARHLHISSLFLTCCNLAWSILLGQHGTSPSNLYSSNMMIVYKIVPHISDNNFSICILEL